MFALLLHTSCCLVILVAFSCKSSHQSSPVALPPFFQFAQFTRTVGDAAVDQQRRMRESYVGFPNLISSLAKNGNATWPIFRIPDFEIHAGQVRLQSGTEVIGCTYLVESSDTYEYLKFVTDNYESSLQEGHMTRYGNMDRLAPIGYTPNFTIFTPNGTFIPDTTIDRPLRSATWQLSPRTLIKQPCSSRNQHWQNLTHSLYFFTRAHSNINLLLDQLGWIYWSARFC